MKNKLLRKAMSALTATVVALSALPAMPAAAEKLGSTVTSDASATMRGLTAIQIVNDMGAGWNLGNSLESEGSETNWGNPVTTKAMIDDIADMGFTTLRVPVRWDDHYDSNAASSYTIDATYMARVEEVVNYGLDNDMYVILNVHHNDLQHNVPNTEAISAELSAIWTQIANHFKNYGDKLIFEVNNEPRADDDWTGNATYYQCVNDCNEAAREAIRATGGNNAERLVMLPTYCASGDYVKAAAWTKDPDDDMIAVSIHAYLPYDFAFEGTGHTDWRYSDEQELEQFFDRMDKLFLDKGIPVVIGEFGTRYKHVDNTSDRNTHAAYYAALANKFAEQSIPCVWWDNNCFYTNGENFGIYDRNARKWVYEDIAINLIGNYDTEPSYEVYTEGYTTLASNVTCSGWGQAASFDASTLIMLDEDDVICCDYSSDKPPVFIMQSFTNESKGWVQAAPESDNGSTASWSRSYLLKAFSGTFDDLGKIYIGDTGADLTVSEIYVPQCENHWHNYTGKETVTVPATPTTMGRMSTACSFSGCDEVKVTTFEYVADSKPANITATTGDSKITLTWDAVSGATKYAVSLYNASTGKYTVKVNNLTATSYTLTGLTNGTEYTFLVQAYVNGAWSKFTTGDHVSAVPHATKPSGIRATTGSGKITLNWNAVDGATKYAVALYNASTGKYTVKANNLTSTSYTMTGLTNGTEYTFLVQAYVNGAWNKFTTGDHISAVPHASKPSGIRVTTASGKITLNWNAVDGATQYAVALYNASTGKYTVKANNLTATSYTLTGLTNGTTYTFLVQAYVNGAWNKFTTADHISAVPHASKPSGIKATTGSGKVTLNWNAVEGATKYAVALYNTSTGKYTVKANNLTSTSYTLTGLTNGTEYTFLVQAYVNGAWSKFTTGDHVSAVPHASKPSGIRATTASGKITLNWNAVEGATKYAVALYNASTGKYTVKANNLTSTSYTMTGLTNGTTYTFLVQAYVNGAWNKFTTADHVSATPTA